MKMNEKEENLGKGGLFRPILGPWLSLSLLDICDRGTKPQSHESLLSHHH